MAWNNYYTLPNMLHWQGYPHGSTNACFYQLMEPLNLHHAISSKQPGFALLGFAVDEGIIRNQGREGAKLGPDAIRQALATLPLHKRHITCYDAGNIICIKQDLESAQASLAHAISLLLKNHFTPIVLGGGHELAFGHYQGIAQHYQHKRLGIVNFDAHYDMRPLTKDNLGTSGTSFLQIAKACEISSQVFDYNCIGIQHTGNIRSLFASASAHQVHTLFADDMHLGNMETCFNFMERLLDDNQLLYLTICLDVFAAAHAPGVSAPQPCGLTPWQVIPLIRQLANSKKVVSYDLAELSPPYDIDTRTAKLAATLIYEIIHHHQ